MNDKTAIVIGASRGIGLGLVQELVHRGYKVIATERSESAELRAVAADHHGQIEIVRCDVTKAASVADVKERCTDGSLDLLIVNAGVYGPDDQSIAALERDGVADIVESNAIGPVQAALTLLPSLKQGATIGMMSSRAGSIDDSSGGANHYRLSKAVQNMLSRSLFESHAKERGIGVISLHPGWVRTEMGGPDGLIDVETSVKGMLDMLEVESEPRHAFLAFDGREFAW